MRIYGSPAPAPAKDRSTIASEEALLVAISVTEGKTSVLDALAAGAGPV
jgi:hypothetical protein